MVREDNGVSPFEVSSELCVGYIAVNALDQVCMWTPGDGLIGSCPAFPCLTDHGQAELAGLIAIECTKRGH